MGSDELYDLGRDLQLLTYCDRSFRDATKILQELIAQDSLTLAKAENYLGTRTKDSLITQLAQSDVKKVIAWTHAFASEGGDMKQLIEDTLSKIHALLLQAHGVDPDNDLPDATFTINQLVKLLKLFHEAYATVRVSPIPQVAVQIAVIEYYQSQPK